MLGLVRWSWWGAGTIVPNEMRSVSSRTEAYFELLPTADRIPVQFQVVCCRDIQQCTHVSGTNYLGLEFSLKKLKVQTMLSPPVFRV